MPQLNPYTGWPKPPPYSIWYPRGKSSFLLSSHQGLYTCIPPTPSSLYLFLLNSSGMIPPISAPVESCRYLPTTSLLLASPLGCRLDFEFNNSLALSQVLAARITVRPVTWYSCRSSLST